MVRIRTTAFALALFAAAPDAIGAQGAQDWPNWRGPNHDGSADATGLPASFSKEDGVAWEAPLPGPGASTPIVLGGRVFLTAVDPEAGKLLAICIDRETGAERWVDDAGSGYRPGDSGSATKLDDRSNYASPSAVADGERVVFFFGNGDLIAYSLDGERAWARNVQEDYGDFAFQWTFGASPALFDGTLFLPVLQRDVPANGIGKEGAASFLLALDPATGEERFVHERPTSAVMESRESYATPIPHVSDDGRKELLVIGGDVITSHDPADGTELWRWGTWNEGHREAWWRVVPSPVVGAGVALACGPKGAPVCAIELGGKGELTQEALRWKSEGRRSPVTTDVPTPLFYDGRFYVLSDLRETLARVDPATGGIEWTLDLDGDFRWRASPTGADGRIWLLDHGGNVLVVDAETGEVAHRAAMGEEGDDFIRSSIAVAYDHLFVRTNGSLFMIGGTSDS